MKPTVCYKQASRQRDSIFFILAYNYLTLANFLSFEERGYALEICREASGTEVFTTQYSLSASFFRQRIVTCYLCVSWMFFEGWKKEASEACHVEDNLIGCFSIPSTVFQLTLFPVFLY